ncbi:hypothetical protein IWW39_005533 [Coemansia spiralis]|uniref:Uncharacterized protein n=1 Tax=Coemansia spiralis TaxID=417178 RepID=A0A9W8GHF2_9FUNG|nr:hypothetical protein IWW39_005533 [Coemansia spiralis]
MAPNVNEIEVRRPDDYTSRFLISEPCYEIFVAQLLQLVGCIQHGAKTTKLFLANIKLNAIGNLAHIKCEVEYCGKSFIELARLSSETLESLIIGPYNGYMSPQFALDKDRGSVVYPRLHTLKLSNHLSNKEMLYPVSTNVMPFLSLRILKLKNECTFGDDVFFRGNSATLEVLDSHLSSVAMAVIRHLSVFTPTSHPKLRSVRFCSPYELVPEHFATKAEALKFALQIGPAATTRDISMYLNGAELTHPLIQLGGLDSIQYLSLSHSKLELWDIIVLIKALPMMSDLSVEPLGIGPLPDDVTLHELPDYMVSTYALMGERFRCWHLIYHDEMDHAEKVRCVFLVALVCPNLTRVTYPWESLDLFVDTMEDEVDSDLFIDYEPRLRHLIDHRTVFWGADCW